MWITRWGRWTGRRRFNRLHGVRLSVLFALALLLGPLSTVAAVPESLAALAHNADTAYKEGDYERAIELYGEILSTEYSSGQLYYNLGNAYFRTGDIGEAIMMFERARRLLPHNRDVRHNLALARERTVDRVEQPPRLFIWSWIDTVRDLFPPRRLAHAGWAFALLTAALIAVLVNVNSGRARALFKSLALVFGVLLVLNAGLLALRASADAGEPAAIMMDELSAVRSAPDPTSKQVFALHEGTKVELVQQLEGWTEIRLADGRQGWVPRDSFETI